LGDFVRGFWSIDTWEIDAAIHDVSPAYPNVTTGNTGPVARHLSQKRFATRTHEKVTVRYDNHALFAAAEHDIHAF
jgi:hypothetical protein